MIMNMVLLEVLICFLLIDSTNAIESHGFEKCLDFFFEFTPPVMRQHPNNKLVGTDICLCEEYNEIIYFATYYDIERKIPVYSAYKITVKKDKIGSSNNWRIGQGLENDKQASIKDYKGIGDIHYDRGHLAPKFYFSTMDGRISTDVLTNIAPQYKKLNRITWLYLERKIYAASEKHCYKYGGETFVITGVIPSKNGRTLNEKIDIPSFLWTAVCCDTSNVHNLEYRFKGWSFAYMVSNDEHTPHEIETFTVNDFLKDERIRNRYVELFATINVYGMMNYRLIFRYVQDCLFDSNTANEIIKEIGTGLRSPNSVKTYTRFPDLQIDPFIFPSGWLFRKNKK